MVYNGAIRKFIQAELYKLCDGEATKKIVREYPVTSTWKPADVFKKITESCLEHTFVKDIYLSFRDSFL